MSKLKKAVLIVFTLLFVMNLQPVHATGPGEIGNLGCPDLSNCSGAATCGSKGTVTGCTITCIRGEKIVCPNSAN